MTMTRSRIGMFSSLAVSVATFVLGWSSRPDAVAKSAGESVKQTHPREARTGPGRVGRSPGPGEIPEGFSKGEARRLHELLADRPVASGTKAAGTYRASSLSSADIKILGQYLRQETDPVKRRQAFARLVDGMTVENAREVREQIAHLSSEHAEFQDFHFAWGQVAGAEAVVNGKDTPKADMHAAMRGFASKDPAGAAEWYRGLQPKGNGYINQGYLKHSMVDGLALSDPQVATSFVQDLKQNGDRSAAYLMSRVAESVLKNRGLEGALDWSQGLASSELQPAALVPVAREYTRKDPRAAAEWVGQFADSRGYANVVGKVGHEWAGRDLNSALAWTDTLSAGSARNHTTSAVYGQWGAREPLQAVDSIMQMEAGTDRNFAINGFISGLAGRDGERAVMWAAEITEPAMRESAIIRAGQRYYQQDREAASTWMQTQGLSPEVQRRVRGDRD